MKGKNIKKLVFTLLTFFIFGVINVNAETVTVYDKDTFTNEFVNKTNTSDVIKLADTIDMSGTKLEQVLQIYKDKTIDLNGNTLILPNYQLSIQYNADATVKFIDSSEGKTGKILGADDLGLGYPLIKAFTDASLRPEETYLVFDGVKIERKTDILENVVGKGTNNTKLNKISFINSDISNFYSIVDRSVASNFYFENVTFKRDRTVDGYLINSSELKVKDVISENSEVVNLNTSGAVEKTYGEDDLLSTVTTYVNLLKVRYKDGFTVSNVNLKETYGYTSATAKEISITNSGQNNLSITNVSVDSADFIISGPTDEKNISAGEIDNSWIVKANDGLEVGIYNATITVKASNGKTYTSAVTLEVEEYDSEGNKVAIVTSNRELNKALDEKVKIIKLANNLTFNKLWTGFIYGDTTIDLNGKTISTKTGYFTFEYKDAATIQIIDSSKAKTGKIEGKDFGNDSSIIQTINNIEDASKECNLIIDGIKVIGMNTGESMIVATGNGEIKNVTLKNSTFNNYQYIIEKRQIEKITFENIKTTAAEYARAYLVQNSGTLTVADVITSGAEVVLLEASGSDIRIIPSSELIKNFFVTNGQSIAVRYTTGFDVSNVELNETYGYTDASVKDISIKNRGTSNLQIDTVTVDSSDFIIEPGSQSNIYPSATDTTWKIKARVGLSAGNYTATIKVTDVDTNVYTATVRVSVAPKELTELGIGGVGSTIEYGTDYTPTLTGTTELGSGDYTIKYAQKDGETYIDLGSSKPTGIGDYKVTISITNENYKQIEVSTTYAIVPKEISPSVGYIAPESYTGEEITPSITVFNGATMLTKDDDYTFEYANNTNAGKAKIIVKPVVGSRYTFTEFEKEFDILPKSITSDSISVTLENTSYKYTGSAIEPKPVVKDGEKTLVEDRDYELIYYNNTNICDNTAKVYVKGIRNYENGVTKYFSIIAKETQTISFDETSVTKTYGDSSFTKKANLTTGDGTIKYTSSNTVVAEVNEISGNVTIKGAGTAVITATASETDTYGASTATYTLTVAKKEMEIERASAISKEYDGTKTAEVDYIIFKGLSYGETLAKDVDYTATAEFDSANVGYSKPVTVKVVLNDTAKANNYSFRNGLPNAEIQTRARIRGKVIKESWVTVDTTTTYTYNGSAHTPNIFVKDGSTTLEKGSDYTVEYTDNTNAGTGNIKVIGIGNYYNEDIVVEKTFTIERKEVILQISDISPVTYNGSKHTPQITVKDKDTGVLLENDTDYTLSYGTNTDAGFGEIIIRSKASSNYTFGETTKTFTINRYSIFSNDVTLEYTSTVYNGTDKRPTVTLKFNGNVIPSSEYSVSYADNKEVGTAKAIVTIDTTNFTGTVEKTFEIVNKTLLTISGISNQEVTYTGSPVVLTGNLTVSNGISPSSLTEKWYKDGTEISKPTNVGVYKVVYSYEDRGFIGKLEVTVEITKKTSTVPSINPKSGVASDKLSSITLPNGFKWVDENETIIAGNKEYNATYTENNDTTNYTTKNLTITVYGKSKVNLTTSVNGIGGLISSSKTNILEGTTEEVKFTPSTGFEISKVLVNGIDKTSSIVNNKLNIVVGASDIDVVVTYKLIQYTITINNVANATIEPSGIIKVDYNSNKVFTIKANIGYKLVSVKVNDVEKLSNIINDKLTLENILDDANIIVVVERNLYEVIEGANQKYTITKDTEARFRFNAEYSKFELSGKVYIDDELLDPSNYISESGSTIITLKKEYVDTLSVGTHKIKVLFVDGEASTTFTVNKITNESNPDTSDNIAKYIITGIISLLGITVSGAYIYKVKKTK